jgi:hypothetical protein
MQDIEGANAKDLCNTSSARPRSFVPAGKAPLEGWKKGRAASAWMIPARHWVQTSSLTSPRAQSHKQGSRKEDSRRSQEAPGRPVMALEHSQGEEG